MDFHIANKIIHKVENEWHYKIMIENGFTLITKEDIGFIRSYIYENKKGNQIKLCTGLSADYWFNMQTQDRGYHATLTSHIKGLK